MEQQMYEEKAIDTTATSPKVNSTQGSEYSHHTGSDTCYSPLRCRTPTKQKKRKDSADSYDNFKQALDQAKRELNAIKEGERRQLSPSKFLYFTNPTVVKHDSKTEELTL